ncbi:RAB6A-GEF complex partner 1-like isoform A [Chlorella sorokiniana]|uniref:RAB6A-GEF complex partner 1-like isoform A n=1 Tax=Chlorella sorokiniana TaxID=3076 RepID=A0A2P6TL05_CHLSO|nr:RAB6A-GEF complex partner 1-like isoform A [Chlorella sorokiniana]|eukprot:PRW44970.1 RAB6A-GEF complex partner 1-like isoform A [Chlorella sorokiniana]
MYFSYGWPRSLVTGATAADSEAIYAAQGAGEYIVVVFNATIQIWSGGEHRLKLGELHRTPEALEEEGPNVRAHWCPQKRVLAVATAANHLQLYSLNVSSEAVWRLPNGRDVRRVNVYLSHSIHLDYGTVRIGDLGGDARSLLVALTNGTMQVFSWQGKLRGQANPFIAAYEGSRSRAQRSRSQALAEGSRLGPRGSLASSSSTTAAGEGGAGAASALLAAMAAMDLPQPTPALPAEVAVARIHYAPAARMLAVVLADGRCALCRTADSGIHPVEQLQLFRWVHKPAGPAAPAVVAAALNPSAQLLALGMSHGRVAIYTMQSLLAHGRQLSHPSGLQPQHQRGGSGHFGSFGSSGALGSGGGSSGSSGAGQPEPVRVLSLADWGFRSTVVGAATQLQWSPDGRVLAVGYANRGMAVWTPSGCRLMCSLRQAVATAMPGGSTLGLGGGPGAQLAAGTPTHRATSISPGAGEGASAGQQGPLQRSSTDSALGSPGRKAAGAGAGCSGAALEQGVLEGAVTALAWSAQGYQLLVAEAGKGSCLHQLEFARQVHGGHRAAAAAAHGGGQDEVQALQAADRILLITEARQSANPALRVPASPRGGGGGGQSEFDAAAAAARPDLTLQHIKLPQQYLEAAYPLMHAAISQDRQDIAVAGTRGLAVYSRRTRRWRLFGDATQERSIQVHGLMWLPGGVIAAVAHVEGGGGRGQEAASPQLLLYPQYHLDSASLLARMPLPQVPVAMDSAGWHMVLAFAPLDLKLYKVTLEGQLGPGAAKQSARLSLVRELSIMGLGNPLQEIALIDPMTLPRDSESDQGSSTAAPSATSSRAQTPHDAAPQQAQQAQQGLGSAGGSGGSTSSLGTGFPQLPPVATRPRTPTAAEPLGTHAASDTPQQCVLLRAGGIMSKLDMQEGSEVLLSDAIERFWLPISPAAAGAGAPTVGGGSASVSVSRAGSFLVRAASGSSTAEGGGTAGTAGTAGGPPLSTSSSMAGLARNTSDAELIGAAAAAAAAQLATAGEGGEGGQPGQPPRVEMPWWTYGARGMQLWFPSSLSEPLTPSLRSMTSPTATGLAAAAAAAASNSTDPELEFDREVYPIGVSLTEVSIIGVMQRVVRSPVFPPEAAQSLCFHPLPESQPVLPCLLRRLLQKGRYDDALELARWHSSGPHFNRSLEWLLFTALEIDADTRPHGTTAGAAGAAAGADGQQFAPILGSPIGGGRTARQARFNSSYSVTVGSAGAPAGKRAGEQRQAGPLLLAAARLISQFPQFPEIVVSVARKTDAALWPALFAAVGSPLRLCQGLMRADQLQSAACCLVIVERIEGGALAQQAALQLMQAALGVGQYGLAADLLRFLVPPGEGEALLTPSSAAAAADSGAAAAGGDAAGGAQQGQQAAEAAGAQAAEAAAAQVQQGAQPVPEQPKPEQPQAGGSWFWGLLGMGGSGAPAGTTQAAAAAAGQQQAAAAAQQQELEQQQEQAWRQQQEEEEAAAAGDAWRLTAQHAWKLLDSGALREAAQLSRALAELHGGLPALLAATAADVPGAAAHLTPSSAAIASALFVAANEFLVAEGEGDAVLAAEILMQACQDAGCINLATALALLLGDESSLQRFATANPAVWADLHRLIANDVHLCGFAPVLSPLPSPVVASVAAGRG